MRRTATLLGVILLVMSVVAPSVGAAGVSAAQADGLDCEFPLTKTDASGTEVTVEQEPERIVTLTPSAAQTLWEIGARERVVGVSQFAGFLEGASERDVVTSGFPSQVNVEKVVGLDPDLVLAPNVIDNATVNQIRDAGITVYRFELADSIRSVYAKTELMGQLTGACDGAEQTVAAMKERIQTVEAAVEGEDEPRVYWGTGAGYTAGPNTFVGQAIAKAGGRNIAADANSSKPYPQLSEEFIAAQDPEFVVVSVSPGQMGKESTSYIPKDSVIRNTTAFQEGNVVVVNTNNLSQPAPRIVAPVTKMAQAFHPDAYAEANTTTTTTSTIDQPTTDQATTDQATTTTATEPTTTDASNASSPGFGVAVTVVAVLGAALLARE